MSIEPTKYPSMPSPDLESIVNGVVKIDAIDVKERMREGRKINYVSVMIGKKKFHVWVTSKNGDKLPDVRQALYEKALLIHKLQPAYNFGTKVRSIEFSQGKEEPGKVKLQYEEKGRDVKVLTLDANYCKKLKESYTKRKSEYEKSSSESAKAKLDATTAKILAYSQIATLFQEAMRELFPRETQPLAEKSVYRPMPPPPSQKGIARYAEIPQAPSRSLLDRSSLSLEEKDALEKQLIPGRYYFYDVGGSFSQGLKVRFQDKEGKLNELEYELEKAPKDKGVFFRISEGQQLPKSFNGEKVKIVKRARKLEEIIDDMEKLGYSPLGSPSAEDRNGGGYHSTSSVA